MLWLNFGCSVSVDPITDTERSTDDAQEQVDKGESQDRDAQVSDSVTSEPEECGSDEFRNQETDLCVPRNLTWVVIPGGRYQIGKADGHSWEMPAAQSVTVSTFQMNATEVTVEQYRRCVSSASCTEPGVCAAYANWGIEGRDYHPVNCVDWDQAVAFCHWAGGRLPSEAEWEYAARGGGKDIDFPWGDEIATCEYAAMTVNNQHGCEKHRTFEVCSKPIGNSAQGLCDMAGNISEWVEDDFHSSYDNLPADGSAWVDEPRSSSRAIRGGSFVRTFNILRASYRSTSSVDNQSFSIGFRCAKEAE